jgi:hypothetical protein
MTLLTSPTSSKSAFQAAMLGSVVGDPAQAETWVRSVATPSYQHIINGTVRDFAGFVEHIRQMRENVVEFEFKVHEFLRDGDQIAVRSTGRMKMKPAAGGIDFGFEAMIFVGVGDDERMSWLKEVSRVLEK